MEQSFIWSVMLALGPNVALRWVSRQVVRGVVRSAPDVQMAFRLEKEQAKLQTECTRVCTGVLCATIVTFPGV